MDSARVARVIEQLGATEVEPGRYAIDADGRWYVCSAEGLLWCDREQRTPDVSEHIPGVAAMPTWWFAGATVRLETGEEVGMICSADKHYRIHRSGMTGGGDITHISCAFCEAFVVHKSDPGIKRHSADLGFYNRMRAKMVKHLHAEHRAALEAGK